MLKRSSFSSGIKKESADVEASAVCLYQCSKTVKLCMLIVSNQFVLRVVIDYYFVYFNSLLHCFKFIELNKSQY